MVAGCLIMHSQQQGISKIEIAKRMTDELLRDTDSIEEKQIIANLSEKMRITKSTAHVYFWNISPTYIIRKESGRVYVSMERID